MTLPPPPARRGRTTLIVGIAVGALLLVAVVATALVLVLDTHTHGGSDPETPTPDDVIRDFVTAGNEADCEFLAEHDVSVFDSVDECETLFEDARESTESQGFDYDAHHMEIDELEVTSETSSDATVLIEVTQSYSYGGEVDTIAITAEYTLEMDGDRWNVTDMETLHEE